MEAPFTALEGHRLAVAGSTVTDETAVFTAPPEIARIALQSAPDAMLLIDALGLILFANSRVEALFGYSREQLIGHSVDTLLPERSRRAHALLRDRYMRRARRKPMGIGFELRAQRSDGSELPVSIRLSPMSWGDSTVVLAAIRDASARKRIEAELLAARRAAEQAREVAVGASQAKSRFLATASHDLRQPLQTLALLNGALRRTVHDSDAVLALCQQEQAIGAMSRLLNALLDISKLESGAIKPAPMDFAIDALFEELRREFTELAANKGLALEVAGGEYLAHTDPALLEQLLRNLMSNAVKYTHSGRITLRCAREPDGVLRIEVRDTGIGIAAEQLSRIYEEFYQIGTADGYGLGLTIVRRIVDLLGLQLQVNSRPAEGSCFSVLVPAASAALSAAPTAEVFDPHLAAQTLSHRQRVLLVEDDSGVRDATRMLLKVEGYRVAAVASLEEALAAAAEGVDLLVTDYHLRDGQTGTEVIAAVRRTLGKPLKCVLITGDTSSSIRQLPRDPDLRVASKPVQAEQLLTLLDTLGAPSAAPPP